MPITIIDKGRGNDIRVDPVVLSSGKGAIVINGDQNKIEIGPNCHALNISVTLGHNSSFVVADSVQLGAIEVYAAKDAHLSVGRKTGFTWRTAMLMHEPAKITIGEYCLFGSQTTITVSDMHSVIDVETGRRINPAADVTIDDRVWLAAHVTVLKGVRIGSGSLVGAASVVTKPVPPQAMAAGSPAKVIRKGVTWRHDLIPVG